MRILSSSSIFDNVGVCVGVGDDDGQKGPAVARLPVCARAHRGLGALQEPTAWLNSHRVELLESLPGLQARFSWTFYKRGAGARFPSKEGGPALALVPRA